MAIDEKINSGNIHKGNADEDLHGAYSFVEGNKFLSQLVSFSLALPYHPDGQLDKTSDMETTHMFIHV